MRTDRATESGGGRFPVTPDLAARDERAGDDGLAAEWRVRLQDAGARLPDTGAKQCAMDIAAVALADKDTSSFDAWAALLKMSASTLRNRLREEGIKGRDGLAFGRVARAITRGDPNDWRPEDVMQVMDERTLGRLLVRRRRLDPPRRPPAADSSLLVPRPDTSSRTAAHLVGTPPGSHRSPRTMSRRDEPPRTACANTGVASKFVTFLVTDFVSLFVSPFV